MTGIKDAKCVLVVGATAGIGRSLALAIHDLDSKPTVIVAGRRQERLDELAAKSDRIKTARVDITVPYDQLKQFVDDLVAKYPDVSTPCCCHSSASMLIDLIGGCYCSLLGYTAHL